MNLYQKINELKKCVTSFTKDDKTTGYGAYTFTSGSQVLSAIKPKMEELGLLFMPVNATHKDWQTFNYTNKNGDEKTDFIVQGELVYEWINADDPTERQTVHFEYYGQQNDISKAFGSALTYSERYLLLKSLGAPTDEDDPDRVTEPKPAQFSYGQRGQSPQPPQTANGNKERLDKFLSEKGAVLDGDQKLMINQLIKDYFPGKKFNTLSSEDLRALFVKIEKEVL